MSENMFLEKGSMQSNLECFLNCTTPVIPSKLLPKCEEKNLNSLWHPWDKEKVEYFTLRDLWNCYGEWSAYGNGVPITALEEDEDETLIQYYVPYLSAIQIFTSNAYVYSFREEAELSGDCETRDSYSSDWCSDESESDKLYRWDGSSSSEEGGLLDQDSSPSLSPPRLNERLGYLYFQYFERATPYGRVPLMDKISGLAKKYPGLMSLKNVDLSPASWMAVAWYPIYHIPMRRTIKELSTCFLTYHTLSSSFQDMDPDDDTIDESEKKRKEGECISLAPFGMATYKLMQGNVWVSAKSGGDQERFMSLTSVADSWLKQLKVQHHDFDYFTGIRRG